MECFGKHNPTLKRVQNYYHVVWACLQTIYAKDAIVWRQGERRAHKLP